MPLAIREQRRDDRMEKLSVIKRLAPNYWLGYYVVYMATLISLCARHRQALLDWSDEGYLFTLAAIFAVSAGTALTSAAVAEGVGYVVLLIPKRIKQIKDEGRAEERERVGKAIARFERGEITIDELRRLTSDQD